MLYALPSYVTLVGMHSPLQVLVALVRSSGRAATLGLVEALRRHAPPNPLLRPLPHLRVGGGHSVVGFGRVLPVMEYYALRHLLHFKLNLRLF